MNKKACITGITGQDGSYLAESLISRGYEVVGLHRRNSTNNFGRINHLIDHKLFTLEEFDITDPSCVAQTVTQNDPDEFYNLAAQSHVGTSFKQPSTTFSINTSGVINILEAIRNYSPGIKFYQASTSEMFGCNFSFDETKGKYQDEETPFSPQSPYAVAKVASHHTVKLYRDSYGLYACSGILFNHESPRRGENFVTRKITKYIGRLINKKLVKPNEKLKLGNIYSYRDWGHAKDYVEAMRMMLNQDVPEDYVIATGEEHSVQEFLIQAFDNLSLNYEDFVEIDEHLFRPAEVDFLKGNASKAKKKLGWIPHISFNALINEMVDSDCKLYNE